MAVAAVGSELVECAVGFSRLDHTSSQPRQSKQPFLHAFVTVKFADLFEQCGLFNRTSQEVLRSFDFGRSLRWFLFAHRGIALEAARACNLTKLENIKCVSVDTQVS